MYKAVTYIGDKYAPGETIPDDLPREKLEWLKKVGAIREAAPTPENPETPEAEAPQETKAPDAMDAPDTEEAEIEDEEAPEEIDIMEGLVRKPETDVAEKPSSTRKATKGGKAK